MVDELKVEGLFILGVYIFFLVKMWEFYDLGILLIYLVLKYKLIEEFVMLFEMLYFGFVVNVKEFEKKEIV